MNHRYIIIEDETLAYQELRRMMTKLRPGYVLAGWAQSIEQAVTLIGTANADLLLVDIQLADGMCFEIFRQCGTQTPIIFTTAFDDYAIKAFKENSIDYLLKPIDEHELDAALSKYERGMRQTVCSPQYDQLDTAMMPKMAKSRFLVQSGNTFRHVATEDAAFFYSEEKYTYLHLFSDRRYIINYSLDKLDSMLDCGRFFRISCKLIVNIDSIQKVSRYFLGKLSLTLQPECPHEALVSRNRADAFMKWMDGEETKT